MATGRGSGQPQIGKDELLTDLRETADTLDTTPTKAEYRERGRYSTRTFERRFESWNTAIEAVGLDPNPPGGRDWQYTDAELLDALERVADELGHTPTVAEFSEHGPCTGEALCHRFGSWDAALAEVGLERYTGRMGADRIPDADLIEDLRAGALVLGVVPGLNDYIDCGTYSQTPYLDRWGSWDGALEAAGLGDDPTQAEIEALYFGDGGGE